MNLILIIHVLKYITYGNPKRFKTELLKFGLSIKK